MSQQLSVLMGIGCACAIRCMVIADICALCRELNGPAARRVTIHWQLCYVGVDTSPFDFQPELCSKLWDACEDAKVGHRPEP